VTFALDCCDREAIGWVASPTGYSGDDIRDLMLESVEKRFGDQLPATPVQWLSDDGSAYTAEQTRLCARQIGLQPVPTPVRSPQSNGMAESFVKTIKRDYMAHMPKPDRETALRNLAIAFEHYNEQHLRPPRRCPMINPPLNKTLGVITFSTSGKQHNLHRLFRVNSGVPIRDALKHASELLHCSKLLALDAAMDKSADRDAWAAHYFFWGGVTGTLVWWFEGAAADAIAASQLP